MSKISYVAFDFETGGVDLQKNPILTGYFCALDQNLSVVKELDLSIMPESPFDTVEPEALRVNGINLVNHLESKNTVSRKQASDMLLSFLSEVSDKKSKPKPLGHNIAFDIDFSRQLLPKEKWSAHLHYGFLCTFSLVNMLKDAGLVPANLGKLESIVDYFNVKKGKAHTAKDDVLMTVEVYAKMIQLLKSGNSGGSDMSIDLLSMLEK